MKDIFNGNIRKSEKKMVVFTLILFSLIMLGCSILFLCIGLFYDKVEPSARILLFIFSSGSFVAAIIYPILTIYFVRRYDKHPKIANMFLKSYVFTNEDNEFA